MPPRIPRILALAIGLAAAATGAYAQTQAFAHPEAAIAALFPQQTFAQWASTTGDWNGDGVPDLALLLNEVNGPYDKPMEIRLVVLAGTPGGQYTPLSASASYCSAQKFFHLEAKGASLFVTAVDKAEGDVSATTALQFRFSPQRGDFELIGKENLWEVHGKEYGRTSTNYPAGKLMLYERVKGRVTVNKEKRFEVAGLTRLNGFDCNRYDDGAPN